jgi:hypothetical protein
MAMFQSMQKNFSPEFFSMIASAARETDHLPWLVNVYEVAIQTAATRSHLSVLVLKYNLILLYKEYYADYV